MGSNGDFCVQVELRNGVARVALNGELDMSTVPLFTDYLEDFARAAVTQIMVDLRDVTFIDSSGLRAFLLARENAQTNGHRFLLIGATSPVRRLFEVSGTEFLLDEQEAVSLLNRFTRDGHDPVTVSSLDGENNG